MRAASPVSRSKYQTVVEENKRKLSIKQRIKACFILLVSGSLPSWWWSDLSNKFYESKKAHDYKDGKVDYRTIRAWFLEQ